jgi:hypothetical protein
MTEGVMMNKLSWTLGVLTAASLVLGSNVAEGRNKSKHKAITLLDPAPDVVIVQNNPATGCAANPTYGFGILMTFDWSSSKALTRKQTYTLTIHRAGALPDTYDGLTESTFVLSECASFVLDQNLSNWFWQVSMIGGHGRVVAVSEQRPFSFAPCRLASGQACNAP